MKLLIVRFSSIGDIVLTTPVIRALSEQLDNPEIHFLTKRKFSSIIENNPHLHKVYLMDNSIDELMEELKEEAYDHIVDLHNNVRTLALKKKLGGPSSTFKKLNLKKWLLVNFKQDQMPDQHVVDRYYGAVESLGVKPDGKPGEFFIKEEEIVDTVIDFNLVPGSYLTIAIGAQFATKRMPEELIASILEKIDQPVVLIGGDVDEELATSLMKKDYSNVHNACGKYSIAGSASIVKQGSKILTNDTGMMHIAACFNVPVVSVWGNTVPALGMYPYYPGQDNLFSMHEVKGLKCRPCSKIGYQKCPKGHFNCMVQQDVNAIIADLQQ